MSSIRSEIVGSRTHGASDEVGLEFKPDPLHVEQRCCSRDMGGASPGLPLRSTWPNRLSGLRAACPVPCTPWEGSGGCHKGRKQTSRGTLVFLAEGILWNQKDWPAVPPFLAGCSRTQPLTTVCTLDKLITGTRKSKGRLYRALRTRAGAS